MTTEQIGGNSITPQFSGAEVPEAPGVIIGDGSKVPDRLRATTPSKVDWWITDFCNLKCDFCWVKTKNIGENRWKQELKDQKPTREKIAKAIDDSDAEDLTLCGGEALLIDALEINEYGKMWRRKRENGKSGKRVTLNTNGTFLKYYADELRKAREKPEVDRIKISLDGADEEGVQNMRGENASFERIVEGAKWAKDQGIEVVLTTVISSQNKDELKRIAKVIKEIQPASWRLLEYSERENDGIRHRISRRQFQHAVRKAARAVYPIPVFPSDNDVSEGCFIIDKDGYRQTPKGNSYIKGDNCLEVPIDRMWHNDPDAPKVLENKRWLDSSGQKKPGVVFLSGYYLREKINFKKSRINLIYQRK